MNVILLITVVGGFFYVIEQIKRLESDRNQFYKLSAKCDSIRSMMMENDTKVLTQFLNLHQKQDERIKEVLSKFEKKRLEM